MKKLLASICVTLLIFSFFYKTITPTSAASRKTFNVGVIVPLTGPLARAGISAANSMKLGDEKFDVDGDVNFLYEDNQYDAKNTVTALQKLISQNKIDAVFVFGSGPALAAAGITEPAQIPMIALAAAESVTEGKKFVFRHFLQADTEAKSIAQEVNKRKYSSIAVVVTENEALTAVHKKFMAINSVKILSDQSIVPAEGDLRAVATKAVTGNPEAIFLNTLAPQTGQLAKHLRQLNYKGEIFSQHTVVIDPEYISPSGSLRGTWHSNEDESAASEFFKMYSEKYNEEPVAGATNAYDSAKLLIAGLKSGDLAEYLRIVKDFRGVLGTYSYQDGGFNLNAIINQH